MVNPLMCDVVEQRLDMCGSDRLGPVANLPALVATHDTRNVRGATGCTFESADQGGDRHRHFSPGGREESRSCAQSKPEHD